MKKIYLVILLFVFINIISVYKVWACDEDKQCSTIQFCNDDGECENKKMQGSCTRAAECFSGDCQSNQTCKVPTMGLVKEACDMETEYGIKEFGINGLYCFKKLEIGETCTIDSKYQFGFGYTANDMCKTGYCHPSTKKCAINPNCEKGFYRLSTGFPGFGSKGQCVDVDSGIANFVKVIVRLIFASIGTITVIIMIVAGFMYAFAAGNPKTISTAKSLIKNAVTGLVMALVSGILLAVINPKLVDISVFKKITPERIPEIQVDESFKYADTIKNIPANCTDSVELLTQNREPYINEPYLGLNSQECKKTNDTIGNSGCGPTSAAMVLKKYGASDYNDPKKTCSYSSVNNFHQCGSGTSEAFFSSIAKKSNLEFTKVSGRAQIIKFLKEGKPLIAYVVSNERNNKCTEYFTSGGHYLVLSCYDEANDSVKIKDPYKWLKGERTSASLDSLINCLYNPDSVYSIYKDTNSGGSH